VLASTGVDALRAAPASLPRLDAVEVGWRIAAFTAAPALIALILFALVPWAPGRRAADDELRGGCRATAGRGLVRVRRALVAFQFAMAVVLLVAAGLIVRSFVALNAVDLGFEHKSVLTFRVIFPFQEIRAAGPTGIGPATRFYQALSERLAALPGVDAVGYASCIPLADSCTLGGLSLRREEMPDSGGAFPATLVTRASPGYLEALSVPLLAGRHFEPRDHEQRTNAMLISAQTARRFFPEGDSLGRWLVQDGTTWTPFTVVGVVGDVQHEDPRKAVMPVVYVPTLGDFAPFDPWAVSFAVRTAGSPLALVDAVRREVQALRPDIPLAQVDALSNVVSRSTARLQFALWLLAVSAAAAVALSALGAYGTMAYVVALRRGEFGIRLALGAEGRQLRALVLRQGLLTAIAGLAAGAATAMLVSRLLQSLLFGVEPHDPGTYLAVLSGLLVTAVVAVHLPARRAARLDPAEILRSE
jgi:predicted permease